MALDKKILMSVCSGLGGLQVCAVVDRLVSVIVVVVGGVRYNTQKEVAYCSLSTIVHHEL